MVSNIFRDKYEGLLEKEARKNQLHAMGHNNSRDSAIDADLQEWETETLELDIVSHLYSIINIILSHKIQKLFSDNVDSYRELKSHTCRHDLSQSRLC